MAEKFYITAAIPYVNAKPHLGHALEFVQTDTIARYHKLLGEDVLALSGGDENALKNVQAAEKAGKPIKEFIDENTELFYQLSKKLNVNFDVWQKGSDQKHYKASQKLWELCDKNGDIYKKNYSGLYCVGCEAFYEPEELNEKGECFEHPGKKLDVVEEENYFFKLSRYQDKILEIIESGELKIEPVERKNEVVSFVKKGLKDISISRSNARAKNWGVPVPGDENSKLYVWMDALNIYQSGVGFGWDEKQYEKWWPADLHVIGKGISRFHAVYWPAFLLSAGLKLPRQLFIHGYYTVNGQKMSKTLGNVYDPVPLLEKYGADPLRYYMLAKTPPFTDGDFSEEKFTEAYNADLANGLGNLVARVAQLAGRCTSKFSLPSWNIADEAFSEIREQIEHYRFDNALAIIWRWITELDQKIEKNKPWTMDEKSLFEFLEEESINKDILKIATPLKFFLPETALRIYATFGEKVLNSGPIFPRIK